MEELVAKEHKLTNLLGEEVAVTRYYTKQTLSSVLNNPNRVFQLIK